MSVYSITTDAQPLFLDGQNQSLSLFNAGPWTIYLDSNTSVGQWSYPLRPATTVVWPANTPLHVKGNALPPGSDVTRVFPAAPGQNITYDSPYQASTLVVLPIENAASSQLSTTGLFTIRHTNIPMPTSQFMFADYPFEADSFKTIVFTVKRTPFIQPGDTYTLSSTHSFNFVWYDEFGNIVTTDKYNLWYQGYSYIGTGDGVLQPQRITVPVKGKYCVVYHLNWKPAVTDGSSFEWLIQGSTDSLPERVDHWAYQTPWDNNGNSYWNYQGYIPFWSRNMGSTFTYGTDFAYIDSLTPGANLLLNNVARNLQLNVRAVGITTAGNLQIHTMDSTFNGGGFQELITIGTGTNSYGPFNLTLPMTATSHIVLSSATVGAVRLTMNWSN